MGKEKKKKTKQVQSEDWWSALFCTGSSCGGRSNACSDCVGGEEEINFEAVYRQTEEKRGYEIDLPKYNKLVMRDPRFDNGITVSEREWIMACCHLGIKSNIQREDFDNVYEVGGLRAAAEDYMDDKFEELDSDGKGYASIHEFKAFMCKYGKGNRIGSATIDCLWESIGLTPADDLDREAFDDAFLRLTGPTNWI